MDDFNKICDSISSQLDAEAFEQDQWNKNEGLKLQETCQFVKSAFATRDDFEITQVEDKDIREARLFHLSLNSNPLAQMTVRVSGSQINIWCVAIDGGIGSVNDRTAPGSVAFSDITQRSVSDALAHALKSIGF